MHTFGELAVAFAVVVFGILILLVGTADWEQLPRHSEWEETP